MKNTQTTLVNENDMVNERPQIFFIFIFLINKDHKFGLSWIDKIRAVKN